jgi:hypothetical protein
VIAKFDQKGSILIGIIAAMVLFAALGTAILSLTCTATMSQVIANSAARAYYLAESGFRYIQGLSAGTLSETGRDSILESLHGRTFTLNDNEGSFHLDVYPYYLKVTEDPYGTNILKTKAPGGLYPEFSPTLGCLKIGSGYYFYNSAEISDSNISFTITSSLPHFPVDTGVFYVAETKNGQTVNPGESINLRENTAGEFPLRNGLIEINGHIYSYKEFDHTGYRLTGIRDPGSNEMEPLTFGAHEKIVLQKFTKIESTGRFGAGDHQSVRKVVYSVPLAIKWQGEKVDFHETFDDSSSRWTSVLGDHDVPEGYSALKVTDAEGLVGTSDSGSLAVFEWEQTEIDLESSYKQAGNFLSYDAQVKIGFVSGVPTTYMAGISFRIVEGTDPDSYGISFVKSSIDSETPDDKIPDSLVPDAIKGDSSHSIVLWQKTGDDRKWLAYKSLPSDFNVSNATILVRIIEAVSIKFNNGGPVPVKTGDLVSGQSSGAKGRVAGSPILDNGGDDWASNNAAGRILLNNINGTFTSNEIVNIAGSETTVTVVEYNSEKANYIRAYYGEAAFIPRGTIEWPPDSANFIQVEWEGEPSGVNPTVNPPVELLDSNTIIRSDSLVTDSFSTNIPETGLHTFGVNSTSIYFDDFAIQAVIEADPINLSPVQE